MVSGLGEWLLQLKPTRDYLWDVSANRQIHKYPSPNQPAKACRDRAVSKEYLKPFRDLLWSVFPLLEAETQSKEDREMASDILWKRLDLGMPLQVDSETGTYEFVGLPKRP